MNSYSGFFVLLCLQSYNIFSFAHLYRAVTKQLSFCLVVFACVQRASCSVLRCSNRFDLWVSPCFGPDLQRPETWKPAHRPTGLHTGKQPLMNYLLCFFLCLQLIMNCVSKHPSIHVPPSFFLNTIKWSKMLIMIMIYSYRSQDTSTVIFNVIFADLTNNSVQYIYVLVYRPLVVNS